MEHLFNSVVAIDRLELSTLDGRATMTWQAQEAPLNYVRCRLAITFAWPGAKALMPIAAGTSPDNVGILYYGIDIPIRPGDRLRVIANDEGEIPVDGVYEVRGPANVAQNYSSAHHQEVQVIEVAQAIADSVLPAAWS